MERKEKFELTPLQERRMRGDLIETFKIIGISHYSRLFFSIFLLKLKIYYQGRIQKLSLLTNCIFWLIYFGNKLHNQIKNSDSVKSFDFKLDDFRKMVRKRMQEYF